MNGMPRLSIGTMACVLAGLVLTALTAPSCGDPHVVLPQTLQVVTIEPPHGAMGIDPAVQVAVVFSHPLPASTHLETYFTLALAATQVAVVTTPTLATDGYTVTLVPAQALEAATSYSITIAAGLSSSVADIAPLPTAIRSQFTTQ